VTEGGKTSEHFSQLNKMGKTNSTSTSKYDQSETLSSQGERRERKRRGKPRGGKERVQRERLENGEVEGRSREKKGEG